MLQHSFIKVHALHGLSRQHICCAVVYHSNIHSTVSTATRDTGYICPAQKSVLFNVSINQETIIRTIMVHMSDTIEKLQKRQA
jgi:hypothetical protein